MNIIIYKGQFQYDVVNQFSDELAKELINIGHDVHLIDLVTVSPADVAYYLLHNQIDLILSFNGVNFTNQNVFEKLGIPLGIILVDHPFFHVNRIETFKGNTTFFCLFDEAFLDAFEECIDSDAPIAWFPHGGVEMSTIDNQEKRYDIVVPASIGDYIENETQILKFGDGIINKLTINLYERGKEDYNIPLYQHFKKELELVGLSPEYLKEKKEYLDIFSHIYILVDKALRARNRYRVIKRLIDEGIKIQHFGKLNNKELSDNKNFVSGGAVNYLQLIEEIKKSRILLHDTPYFQNGSHERILTGMLNKTLVFSNINNYCNNRYKDGKNIVYYNMNDLNILIEKTRYYLENEDDREKIITNAYETAKTYDTWGNRAKEIMDIYYAFLEARKK
ncbi:MAG: glycosyltransferase [Tissierellaceae bacterium]